MKLYRRQIAGQPRPTRQPAPSSARHLHELRAEMRNIESKMGTPAYTKNERMQARYRQLIDLVGVD